MQKKLLWKLVTLALLAVIAGGVVLLYVYVLKPQPVEGIKEIDVLIRVEEENVLEERHYTVRTDAKYLLEVIEGLNESYDLDLVMGEGGNAGMIMGMFGVMTPSDWSKSFTYYTTNTALYNADGEYFGGYTVYGDKTFGLADYGVADATLADGTAYLIVYAAYQFYNMENPVPVIEAEPVSAEVWTEEATGEAVEAYDKQKADAKTMLITICSIIGAAILAVGALAVAEAVKAKKA